MEISYLTIGGRVDATQGFRLPSLVSRPGRPRIVEPTHARIAQMVVDPTAWPSAGTMPVRQPAAQQHEGGALAGFGGCDVTDTKFSTRVGPHSCSPPV
jgi:anti-sigma factor RsiW